MAHHKAIITQERLDVLRWMVEKRYKLDRIAGVLGIGKDAVRYWMKKLNLKLPNQAEGLAKYR